ncbi:hypothetical protein AB0L06_07415 [Spirillospora sp. NPDC052269]
MDDVVQLPSLTADLLRRLADERRQTIIMATHEQVAAHVTRLEARAC